MTRPQVPGLQAERTGLSWERTALAALAGTALLLLRHIDTGWGSLVAAVAGLALALLAAVTGARRTARLRRTGNAVPVARAEVLVVGGAVAVFGALVVVALLVG